MRRAQLVDGHGRDIGDVRISVTDRCNFRCQYCMPAEGLPWLDRDDDPHLRGDRARGRAAGVDGRARRAPDRRRAARAPRAVEARRDAQRRREHPRPLADHQRLPARAPGREAGARPGCAASTSRWTRSRRTASSSSPAATRSSRCSRAWRRPSSYPELRPIKVNVVALKDFTEDEVVRFAEFARKHPYEVRFIEFMPLDADRTWSRDRVLPNAEVRRLIHAAYPLKDLGRERHGTSRRWEFADGQGSIGFISPGQRAVLRRLQPDPHHRRGQAAHLPVLDDRDRPARAAARRRLRRRARDDHPRRRLGEGAQAPRQRRGLRAAAADDVADRRMKDFDEALGARPRGDRAARRARRVALPRRAVGRVIARRGARGDRPAAVRPHGDGRLRGARRGRLAGRGAARDRRPGRGRRRRSTLEPGTAARISTGAAIPAGADAVLRVEDAEVRDGVVVTAAAVAPGLHIRRRAEDVHAGDVLARPGDVLTVPRLSALASAGVATRRRPAAPARGPDRHRQRAAAAGRAARAGQDLRVQLARGRRDGRGRGRAASCTHPPVPDDFEATRAAVEARPGGRHPDRLRRRLGRPARPRQARVRGVRRRGGLLARADQARQAAVVRPPRPHARLRAARATRCRRSSAPRCSSSPRCACCAARPTPARASTAAASASPPARPTTARRS